MQRGHEQQCAVPSRQEEAVIQFQSNADYPSSTTSLDPLPFPPAIIDPCARITTRVYNPKRDQVATVQNVLVRTMPPPGWNAGAVGMDGRGGSRMYGSSTSSSSGDLSDSDDSDDEAMMAADEAGGHQRQGQQGMVERAFWLQRTLREAIYGRVKYAVVLKRRSCPPLGVSSAAATAEWEVTDEKCAVKEMSWQHIRRERDRLAEDPIKEVSAMQFLQKHIMTNGTANRSVSPTQNNNTAAAANDHFNVMMGSNIMMPMDLLSDDRYLYSVMPYCDGGELFDRLDMKEKFSEEEARYWMHQLLNGVENLQRAGICHRDMSLENLLVHDNSCLIIDMGMCLRIPYKEDVQQPPTHLTEPVPLFAMDGEPRAQPFSHSTDTNGVRLSLADMSIGDLDDLEEECPPAPTGDMETLQSRLLNNYKQKSRYLLKPQGTCGKWHYMSPEICQNKVPFDGYAIDIWATGVILFLMTTGFPPWERPCQTDERFKYMTAGYLVQMLTEWELGLSSDLMDLLQRMLWLDPRDRLCLEQVRAHPWMVNGSCVPPMRSVER